MYTYVCTYSVHMRIGTYVHRVCTYVHMYICTYLCTYVCTYSLYVCVTYVHMYVRTYILMYICTFNEIFLNEPHRGC